MKIYSTLILLLLLFASCKNKGDDNKWNIFSKQNYTDLLLEESEINTYFSANKESVEVEKEVREFYSNRKLQFAWFNKKGMTQAVPNFYNQLQNYSTDFNDATFKNKQLDSIISFVKTNDDDLELNESQKKNLELFLTTTFFKYSEKVYGGITKNPHQLDWFIPRNKKNYQAFLDSTLLKNTGKKAQEPVNIYYSELRKKLSLYRNIQKKGGFPVIKTSEKLLSVNMMDSSIINVKKRLFLTEDLKKNDRTNILGSSLTFTGFGTPKSTW